MKNFKLLDSPPFYLKTYFKSLSNQYHFKFILLVISNYFGVVGVVKGLQANVDLPFYSQGKWSGDILQLSKAISSIPSSIKGFGGVISDVFPLFGYQKTSYMFIYSTIGTISMIILGLFPLNAESHSHFFPISFFFLLNIQIAFNDLLCQGKYVDLMKQNSKDKGLIISFSYTCISAGGLLPILVIGPFSDAYPAKYLFLFFAPFSVQTIAFLFYGCMIQDKVDSNRSNRIDVNKISQNIKIVFLAAIITLCALGSFVMSFFLSPLQQFIYCIVVSILIMVSILALLPSTIAKINIYMYIVPAAYVNLSGNLEYFYTSDNLCVQGGPQFSLTYFKTFVGIASLISQIIGIFLFQKYFIKFKIRFIYWFTTFLKCLASVFDIFIIKRWNLMIGIPDKVMYIFGNGIIYESLYMLDHMPTAIMLAKLCPKDVEATTFALLAGFANFGVTVANFIGIFLSDAFGIVALPKGPGCNFENLVPLIIIGHLIMPLLTVPFTFFLIPNTYISENII